MGKNIKSLRKGRNVTKYKVGDELRDDTNPDNIRVLITNIINKTYIFTVYNRNQEPWENSMHFRLFEDPPTFVYLTPLEKALL